MLSSISALGNSFASTLLEGKFHSLGTVFTALLLAIMTLLAQSLPVRAIPEKQIVTPVRFDVIYHRRNGTAHSAVRMPVKELSTGFAPLGIVTALCRRGAFCVVAFVTGAGAGDLTNTALTVGNNTPAGARMWRAWH